jgi:hypothetical protein
MVVWHVSYQFRQRIMLVRYAFIETVALVDSPRPTGGTYVPQLLRAVVWTGIEMPAMEYFGLWADGESWQLRGTVVGVDEGRPFKVQYAVACDREWHTRAVHIGVRSAGPERTAHLTVDDNRRWTSREGDLPDLEGCIDVDLEVTPSTNTLPICRLRAPVGHTRPVTAAWIRFPDLSIQPLGQTYTRLAERGYRYESETGCKVDLEFDDLGLVLDYPGGWRRESSADPSGHVPAQPDSG